MITTERLVEVATHIVEYSMADSITVQPPMGIDPLPDEWDEKIGEHDLEQPFVAVVEDVELCGSALVGLKNNDVILDTAYFGRMDLWERNSPYFQDARTARKAPERKVKLACSLCSVWSHNYFHWVLDVLPKIEALWEYEDVTGKMPAVYIHPNPPPFVTESLKWLGIEYREATHPHYRVEQLIVPTTRRKQGFLHPSAVEFLRFAFTQDTELYTSGKLYISRKKAQARRVVNEEDDLYDPLLQSGFSIVMPENWSFTEQVNRFHRAEWVIGAHGAGLINAIWGTPKVLELVTPAYENPCCWLACVAAGCDYGYLVCEPVPGENMMCWAEDLMYVMDLMGDEV